MNKHSSCFRYFVLGYNDYIASRFLLNNNFPLQGLTLASSAVEKYLKALLIFKGQTKKVHLDKLTELKELLSKYYYDVTQKFDPRFLELLGKAYECRYFDNLKTPISIGFFVNQVIVELDSIIHFIETKVVISIVDGSGNVLKTPYKKAVEANDKNLTYNNFLFNSLTKKEQMEKSDTGYGIFIHPTEPNGTIEAFTNGIVNKYEGTINEIKMNFKPDNDLK